jgi:hypothetical protein
VPIAALIDVLGRDGVPITGPITLVAPR